MSASDTSALIQLQKRFQDYLLETAPGMDSQVKPGGRIPVDKRLGIYHNAYRVRLVDNLRDTFEKTWAYLGDDTFEQCARAFIEIHPPVHRSLRDYGAALPGWLERQFPRDADVAELAQMDWLLRQAFDGEDAEALPLEILAELGAEDWETIGLEFVPTLSMTPLRWNTPAIWHALDKGLPPPESQALLDQAWLLVWRRGWQPHFRSLDAVEHLALGRLVDGMRFADLCQALADAPEAAPDQAAHYLRTWMTDGLVRRLVKRAGNDGSGNPSSIQER